MSKADPAAQENRRPRLKRNSSAPSSTPEPSDGSLRRPPLRRGSSFTFLTPGPWDFTLKKRKRRAKDDDAISLCSLDIKKCKVGTIEKCIQALFLANEPYSDTISELCTARTCQIPYPGMF